MEAEKKYPLIESSNPRTCISGNMMKANRIIANVFRKHLKPFGITDSQLSILFILTKMKDVNQKKLSQFLVMEKSTVNRNISRLLQNGYIEKKDGSFLGTSEKGKDFLETVLPHWHLAMEESRSILGMEGQEAMAILLGKLGL